MIVWRWIRGLRWWWQTLIAAIGIPLALALLYVGGRSLQYLTAEGDAGRYAPASVHVLARARGLEAHLDRIEASFAWNTIERKLLRDPAIRPRINSELRETGKRFNAELRAAGLPKLPTLDDLQDPRQGGQLSRSNLSRFFGRDLVVGVAARDSWKTARFCVATRLRWLEYLATPFAPLALKRDGDLLRKGQVWIGFAGAVAIAGNDKALVEEALRGKGKAPEGGRPVEVSVRFDGSRPLSDLRASIADLGLLPHVKFETAKGLRVQADLDGSTARIEAVLEGVETAYPGQTPPNEMLARAPGWTTGMFSTTASFRDLYGWAGGQGKFVRELVDQLERGKLSEVLLPLIDAGIAVMTGAAENDGKLYPAIALMVRTSDPKRAADALTQVVKKIGGNFAENRFKTESLGDAEVFFMDTPDAGKVDDFLTPTWGAVEGGLVFGNNLVFTKSVIAAGGEVWRDRRIAKRLGQKLKDLGFVERPGLAGGVLVPPLLLQSFDGVIEYVSRMMAVPSDAVLASTLDREYAEQGRSGMTAEEKRMLFLEAREVKIQEYEADLRRSLRGLDPIRWCAFESAEVTGGVSVRVAIGFDSLTDR